MSNNPMCYKIVSNRDYIEIHTEYRYKSKYKSSDLRFFNDPYLQQLWLNMLVTYQETFHELIHRINEPIFIPIYQGHRLSLDEQNELFKIIKQIQNDNVGFVFFAFNFNDFEFKETNLNQILTDYQTNRIIEEYFIKNAHLIEPGNFENTINEIEYDTCETENPFEAPIKLKQHIRLLIKLYKDNQNQRLTKTAYHILLKILSQDFDLFNDFVIPHNSLDIYKMHDERPPYQELCQKYGKNEIDYLIHEYLLL